MPKKKATLLETAAAAPPAVPRTLAAGPAIGDLAPAGRQGGSVHGKSRHENLVRLLGITVVLGRARWMAAAAAGDAGSSPGARLAAYRAARGVRAAMAAVVRGRARAGA